MDHPDNSERFFSNTIVHQNLKQKSVRAALFMALGQGVDFLLRFISTIILARLLLPEYFGLLAMVAAVIGIAEVIRDLGLSTATVQRENISHLLVSNLFWINLTAGILFFLFFSAISILISKFYSDQRLTSITIVISTNFFWSGLNVQHQALLNRQLKQGQISLIQLSANIISLIVAILLAIGNYEYWALVWREVIRNVMVTGGVWLFCPWIPGLPRRNVGTKELIKFGKNLTLTNLLIGVISKIDGLLIGRFFGAATLGSYRQAYQLMFIPIEQINGPILSVAQPGLSRLQSDPERYRRYYQKILFLVSLTTVPLGIFVAVYAREIVLFLLGVKWIEAIPFLRIFGIATVIRPLANTYGIVLITCGKSTKYFIVAVVHCVVLIILMTIFIQWGAIGIAIAHITTSVILIIPKLYYSYAGTPVTVGQFFKTIKSPFTAGVVMMSILYLFHNFIQLHGVIQTLSIGGIIGMFVYSTVLFLFPEGIVNIISLYKDIITSLYQKSSPNAKKRLDAV